jgi:hypothetical protein
MLNFPNPSRIFDPTRRAVRFWGHNSAIEWSFFVTEGALERSEAEPAARLILIEPRYTLWP